MYKTNFIHSQLLKIITVINYLMQLIYNLSDVGDSQISGKNEPVRNASILSSISNKSLVSLLIVFLSSWEKKKSSSMCIRMQKFIFTGYVASTVRITNVT